MKQLKLNLSKTLTATCDELDNIAHLICGTKLNLDDTGVPEYEFEIEENSVNVTASDGCYQDTVDDLATKNINITKDTEYIRIIDPEARKIIFAELGVVNHLPKKTAISYNLTESSYSYLDWFRNNIIVKDVSFFYRFEGIEVIVGADDTSMFYGATNLETFYYPKNLKKIIHRGTWGNGIFSNTNIKTIVIDSLDHFLNIECQCDSIDANNLNSPFYGGSGNLYLISDLSTPLGTESNPIIIPESYTKILNAKFAGFQNLTSILLHNGITLIGEFAFWKCLGLVNLSFPSVTSIKKYAFSGCTNLQLVGIEFQNVTNLEKYAFYNCLNIPFGEISLDNITTLNEGIFYNCKGLTKVVLPETLTSTSIPSECFTGCSNLTSLNIPDSIVTINRLSLNGAGISSLNLNNVTNIEQGAILTSYLKEITINKPIALKLQNSISVTKINIPDWNTWFNCTYGSTSDSNWNSNGAADLYINGEILTEAILSSDITKINQCAFKSTRNIEKITGDGSNVISIGSHAFLSCKKLKEIPDFTNLTTISAEAFKYSAIKNINLSNCTYLGWGAFFNCVLLSGTIDLSSVTTAVNNGSYNQEVGIFLNCHSLEKVLNINVTTIPYNFLRNCKILNEVSIGSNCTYIYGSAFLESYSLSKIILPETPPTLQQDTLSDKLNYFVVPTEDSKTLYLSATNWKNCSSDRFVLESELPTYDTSYDYISNEGSEGLVYLNTLINCASPYYRMVVEFNPLSNLSNGDTPICGIVNSNWYTLNFTTENRIYIKYATSSAYYKTITLNNYHTAEIAKTIKVDDEILATVTNTNSTESYFGIFGNNSSTKTSISVRIKSVKIYETLYDEEFIICNWIPALRNDGTPGMLNTITNVFIKNSGTGTLILGNDEE